MANIVKVFEGAAPRAYPNYTRAFQNDASLFDDYGINTPIRIAHFLAQTMHECGRGTVLFENLKYKTEERLLQIFGVGRHSAAIRPDEAAQYLNNEEALAERVYGLGNPRKARELGNTRPGDGFRYRGGGLMQTTGGDAYKRWGAKARADFYGDPVQIVDPAYAVKPALYEWKEKNCNPDADRNDIATITKKINGGYNGLTERTALFEQFWPIANKGGDERPAWQDAESDDEVRWLQQALNDLGADPALLVDGRSGPATTAAVKWFQGIASLKMDGIAGDITKAAIRLRLDQRRG
jgi:putative chitinase